MRICEVCVTACAVLQNRALGNFANGIDLHKPAKSPLPFPVLAHNGWGKASVPQQPLLYPDSCLVVYTSTCVPRLSTFSV